MKIRTCPFCKIPTSNSPHIYSCKLNKITNDKREIKYLYIIHNFPLLTKNLLYEEYFFNKKSLPDIYEKYEIDFKSVCFLLDYYDLSIRSISESTKLSTNKKIKTCIDKYGVEWYSQTDIAKKSKKETFNKKYGSDNIWKSDYFKQNLDKYFFKKYGLNRSDFFKKKWISLSDDDKSRIIKEWYSKCTYSSGLEKRIKSILDDIGITYLSNSIINNKSFDIVVDNKIIEIQGDFWHANPSKYKQDDILNFPGKKVIAKDLWKKDEDKKIMIENLGYKIFYLWESDINRMSDKEIIQKLLSLL